MILAVIFLFHTHDIGNSYHNSCRCRILCPLYNSCCTWHFPDDTAGSTPKHILQDLAPSLVAWRCVPMLAKEQRITQGGSWGWEENAWLGLVRFDLCSMRMWCWIVGSRLNIHFANRLSCHDSDLMLSVALFYSLAYSDLLIHYKSVVDERATKNAI